MPKPGRGKPGACFPPLLSPGAGEQGQHRPHPSSQPHSRAGVLPTTLGLCPPSVLWESFGLPISSSDPHRLRPRHHVRRKELMTPHGRWEAESTATQEESQCSENHKRAHIWQGDWREESHVRWEQLKRGKARTRDGHVVKALSTHTLRHR